MDTLKEKLEAVRRADSRVEATAETRAAKETERRHRDARREENCALWIHHHARMAEEFARLSANHARRARALELGFSPTVIAQVVGIDVGWVNLALLKAGEVRGEVSYAPPPRSGVVDSGRAATP